MIEKLKLYFVAYFLGLFNKQLNKLLQAFATNSTNMVELLTHYSPKAQKNIRTSYKICEITKIINLIMTSIIEFLRPNYNKHSMNIDFIMDHINNKFVLQSI